MERNLMNEKLVWTTEEDFSAMLRAINVATLLLNSRDVIGNEVVDLDGDLYTAEEIDGLEEVVHQGHLALSRTKYVPEETLPKLRLILMSE